MQTDEVALTLSNDAAIIGAEYVEKELVLTGQDKDWVVNAFNKDSFEKYGLPAKVALNSMVASIDNVIGKATKRSEELNSSTGAKDVAEFIKE